jgi:hypothetical protein
MHGCSALFLILLFLERAWVFLCFWLLWSQLNIMGRNVQKSSVFHHLQMFPVQMAAPVPYVPLNNRPNNGLCEFFPTNSMVYIVAFQSPESWAPSVR